MTGSSAAADPTRNGGIDALRASTTLLVVLHHTALTYGAIGGWFYREIATDRSPSSLLLVLFCTVNQAWFMGLFFLLAGRFTPSSVQRKGRWSFMRDRLLRLGVPWLVFGFLVGPMTIALANTVHGKPFIDTLLRLWRHGEFEPGPLWFAQALLIFSAVAACWPWPRETPEASTPFPSNRILLISAGACGAVAFALRLVWPVGSEVAHMQLGYFASYVLLFAVGCMAASRGWFEHLPEPVVRRWRRVAWCVLPTLLPLAVLSKLVPAFAGASNGGWTLPALMYAFWEPFVAWGILLGMLLRFDRNASQVLPSWKRALARRAYSIFVIHPPVVVAVSLAWRALPAPPLLKFAVTGSLACVLCFVIAGWLLRVPGVRRVL